MTRAPVLVVDDDPVFVRAMRRILEQRGMEVHAASAPLEGLALLRGAGRGCVVLGAALAGGNGLDIVRTIRLHDSQIPIIVVSDEGEIEVVLGAMRHGVTDYVKRPFSPQEIAARVEMAFESMLDRWELDEWKAMARAGGDGGGVFLQGTRWRAVRQLVEQVAGTDITVLITGENGTGKGLVARLLHERSARAAAPFVRVSCSFLRGRVLEKALFGWENGEFVDRPPQVPGHFETAGTGTVFLDEVSEIDPAIQGKLLTALREKRFRPGRMEKELVLACRVLASTRRDLAALVEEGKFRRDLFHRLNVVNIHLPALRECKEDIPLLAGYFIERYSEMYGRTGVRLSPRLLELLVRYPWPDNVRELEREMRMFVVTGDESRIMANLAGAGRASAAGPAGGALTDDAAPGSSKQLQTGGAVPRGSRLPVMPQGTSLKVVAKIAQRNAERELIEQVLRRTRWNRRKAAQLLGISYRALLVKIRECGLGEE